MCLERLCKVSSRISLVGAYFAGALLAFVIVINLAEIVYRGMGGKSLLVTVEFSSWAMVGIGAMGLAFALKEGAHIRIVLITSRLRPRVQSVITMVLAGISASFITYFTICIFGRLVAVYTGNILGMSYFRFPMYIPWTMMFVGFCLFALQFISIIIEQVMFMRQGGVASYSS